MRQADRSHALGTRRCRAALGPLDPALPCHRGWQAFALPGRRGHSDDGAASLARALRHRWPFAGEYRHVLRHACGAWRCAAYSPIRIRAGGPGPGPKNRTQLPGQRATDIGIRDRAVEEKMPMNKPHLEFTRVDMNNGWATPTGYPAGIKQKILASDLDETRKMGSRTRLLRIEPGVYTTAPFVHDHWEEVYLISGDLIVGNDAQGKGGESFDAPTYACRPPGVYHGPFKSERGCLLYEIHYYDESRK